MPDVANPVAPDGALVSVDWWAFCERVINDVLYAGGVAAALGLLLWAVLVRLKPGWKPQLVAKAVVMGLVSPMLVILLAYVARLVGQRDYFSLERLLAVLETWYKVTLGTGVWGILAHVFGIDLDLLRDLVRLVLQARKAEKAAQAAGEDEGPPDGGGGGGGVQVSDNVDWGTPIGVVTSIDRDAYRPAAQALAVTLAGEYARLCKGKLSR